MPYSLRDEAGVLVFEFSGFLGRRDSFGFLEAVRGHIAAGARRIVVSLAGVDQLNSAGVGVIFAMLASARHGGADLRLACVPDHAWRIMTIVGLAPLVTRHASVEEAVANL